MSDKTKELGQYMTPAWAARELWEVHFSDVGPTNAVLEPTCGDGRMLQCVPKEVPAFGVELDGDLALSAHIRTGRDVLWDDILTCDLPRKFDVVFGNPPFKSAFIQKMLDRLCAEMDHGLRCGVILPAYVAQTPKTILRWSRDWTIYSELLPRTLFPRARLPLIFAILTKDPIASFKGLRLYLEADSVEKMNPAFKEMMRNGTGTWREVVASALKDLGGEEHLAAIYDKVWKRRRSDNPWWREKVRQTLQRGPFTSRGGGIWKINEEVAA